MENQADEEKLTRLRELAQRGANRDPAHPDREEWKRLRDELFPSPNAGTNPAQVEAQ